MTVATTLQRLLKYPHAAVFDKSPHTEPVLRVRSEAGLSWRVADEVLALRSGDRVLTYDLDALTVGQLAAALHADGFEVSAINPAFAGLRATVLAEGSGDQSKSNGDRLGGFTSLLWSLYGGYARELRAVRSQIEQALHQMVITQAENEWLDLWGSLYGVERSDDEGDGAYQPRIPQEAFRIRVNALAIEKAIKDATGKDVRIEEPWGSMFRLDESALSGSSRFYNGEHVGYHLLRPVSETSIDWSDVLPVIERNRAAGVLVLPPETRYSSFVDASLDGTVWFGLTHYLGAHVQMWIDNRLNYMRLSDEEITRNWPVMISNLLTLASADPLLDPDAIAAIRNIAMASIALSEGAPLGDENGIFPRAQLTQLGGEMVKSDNLELSDPDQAPVWKPADRITLESTPRGQLVMLPGAAEGVTPWEVRGAFVALDVDGTSVVGRRDSLALDIPQIPMAVRVYSTTSDISGFTWRSAGEWGPFPWKQSARDLDLFVAACERLHAYVHTQLPIDLSPNDAMTSIEQQIVAATDLHTYVHQQLPLDLEPNAHWVSANEAAANELHTYVEQRLQEDLN